MTHSLTFEAVAEARPGPRWQARWNWSWPAYEAWFRTRGGDSGPSRAESEAALRRYMPELVPIHAELSRLVGDGDREARFLSGWCPPAYLGGCSLAAVSDSDHVRLVRNYDLSPDLNEGLLLRSEWRRAVMGMVEFLWGLSDGINDAGLSVALAFGGSGVTREGFGITTILRYILETCSDVPEAIARLERIPSHMGYNLVLADRSGRTASVEMQAGGGLQRSGLALATNHQGDGAAAERPVFTQTKERRRHLERMVSGSIAADALRDRFLEDPLFRTDFANGFGTLFTAEYDPKSGGMVLAWPGEEWRQRLDVFKEGRRSIQYRSAPAPRSVTAVAERHHDPTPFDRLLEKALCGELDWIAFGQSMAQWQGSWSKEAWSSGSR